MQTRSIRFIQILVNSDHIIGLDRWGRCWYRDVPPRTPYNNGYNSNAATLTQQEKEKKAKGKLWKPLGMDARVQLNDNGPAIPIPPGPDIEVDDDTDTTVDKLAQKTPDPEPSEPEGGYNSDNFD